VLLRSHHEPPTVFRYFRAADLCYVSSLHDGMNLVAKEFVAARDDERGVLVLSQFTGAARDLTEALMVNPYDLGRPATRWRGPAMPPMSSASGCARCEESCPSSTCTAGRGACSSTRRSCAAASG
jgi:trehalose-6-phosphate synthase